MAESAELPAFRWGCRHVTPLDNPHSFPTATVALSLRAGFSLAYLSDIPGPPQVVCWPVHEYNPSGGEDDYIEQIADLGVLLW